MNVRKSLAIFTTLSFLALTPMTAYASENLEVKLSDDFKMGKSSHPPTFLGADIISKKVGSIIGSRDSWNSEEEVSIVATPPPPPPPAVTKVEEEITDSASEESVEPLIEDATTTTEILLSGEGTELGNAIVKSAASQIGVPYVWGGSSPSGFDCSGLVQYVYALNGIHLPRNSDSQGAAMITTNSPVPGDVVWYPGHVGIYIGNGQMIHSPYPGTSVTIDDVYGYPLYKTLLTK